jgi:hypothetical protein
LAGAVAGPHLQVQGLFGVLAGFVVVAEVVMRRRQ